MELTYVTIMVLASMIFVLSAMVGYLYWQQTRMLQHVQSLALALAAHVEYSRQQQVVEQIVEETEEEDDRVSVKEQLEVVEGPPATATANATLPVTPPPAPVTASEVSTDDVDDLQDKTSAELRELLTKKGIPYGKRDSKTVLLQLLKATS